MLYPCSLDLLVNLSTVSQPETQQKLSLFHHPSYRLSNLDRQVLRSTGSGVETGTKYDKYIHIVGVNTHNWFDIDLSKKHWFDKSVEGQRGHYFSMYLNCTPLRTGTQKQEIQVKIAGVQKRSIPSPIFCIPTKWISKAFYVYLLEIWIVLTMLRFNYSMF